MTYQCHLPIGGDLFIFLLSYLTHSTGILEWSPIQMMPGLILLSRPDKHHRTCWGTEKANDVQVRPILILMTVTASSLSCDSDLGAWHQAGADDGCTIPASHDHHLQPSQPASLKQRQWGKPNCLNNLMLSLMTMSIKVAKLGVVT